MLLFYKMTDYINKFIKYKKKCNYIEKILFSQQTGGDKNNHIKKYTEKLEKIEEKVKKKGRVFWFDENLKLIVKSNSESKAKNEILKKIEKNIDKWENETLCCIVINFDFDNVLDEKSGGIDISVEINKVTSYEDNKNNKQIILSQKNRKHSILRLFYKYDELNKFDISDLKKIADMMMQKKMPNVGALKFYHYSDIEDFL